MEVRFSSLLKTKSEVNKKPQTIKNQPKPTTKTTFTVSKSQVFRELSLMFHNVTYTATNFIVL